MSLNAAQTQAVEGCGVQLILAGPGSGKTLVITEKILHLLASGIKLENILALTFSKKAAQEMIERLEKSIDPSDLTIGTFHSFCFGVLQDNVLDSGISFSSGHINRTNQLVWALRNVDSFGFEHLKVGNNAARLVESIMDSISAFKDELISIEDLERYLNEKDAQQLSEEERNYLDKLSDLLKVYQAYEPYKRKEQLLTHYSGLYKNNIDGGNIRNVTLLNRFYKLVQEYASLTREASVEDLLAYLELLSGFDLEIEDYEETDSVKVMTVHQSKGKEFPVVFVIDLAANKFPSKHRSKPFYVPSDLSRGLKIEEDESALYEQEERRLLYVAMTRAEHKLYLTYAEQYGNNKNKSKPSPFLFELHYENNPLVERLCVEQEDAAHILSEESPVEKAKRKLQE